jgi:ankyrin repeat protein
MTAHERMSGNQPNREKRPGLDVYGRTELHYAACEGNLAMVRTLLAFGAPVDMPDDNGWTPLHFAAQAHAVAVAESLLAAGASVDSRDARGNTPLINAVFNSRGNGDLITLLRRHGADPNIKNAHGISAVTMARSMAGSEVKQCFTDLPE